MAPTTKNSIPRPPVIAVVGHIDHGKSTLLDYIRKSNVVEGEAGGITQHLSAYEFTHQTAEGKAQRITFLDTPGHEAFSAMRSRGVSAADIAILIVSAEDSVKAQTLEAYRSIQEAGVPFLVAINKIDKPNANIEKTKADLAEVGIYLEGYGGQVPFVNISAKHGDNIPELLDMLLLIAELEELVGDVARPASGIVIESNVDPKRGTSATLLIKNGTLETGMFVAAGTALSPVRILEDFTGTSIDTAMFSSPVRVVGFNEVPHVGTTFESFKKKKDAEEACKLYAAEADEKENIETPGDERHVLPVIIKTDVAGSIEAIVKEIERLSNDRVVIKAVHQGVGSISENDIKNALGDNPAVIVGFNVKTDSTAEKLALRDEIEIRHFSVIYKITEWLKEIMDARFPEQAKAVVTAKARILKVFSARKNRQVIGGDVLEGVLKKNDHVVVTRATEEIGTGKILGLQMQKLAADQVNEGNQFGAEIETTVELFGGDIITSVT